MQIDASIVLDELVHQFADPMAFFRELIQNSIDAGTGDVDITVEFEPSDDDEDHGRMTVEIRDFGVGMDRQIIQDELLELFSSGKDRDLTKIGRFGIGFVSVFAVEPDAVCVDTSRTGESWRLLFDADRTYELFERDIPFEGTSVRLFKHVPAEAFDDFEMRAYEVIYQWCKHVEVPIYFNGEEVHAPFDVDSPCTVEMETEGTRIVAGLVEQAEASYGYYHSGLTLMESRGGPWPHVSFKLDSRYLEHTLTRDQIVEDKNFHKALELLEEVVRERLPSRLVTRLEEAVVDDDLELVESLAGHLLRQPPKSNFWGRDSRLSAEQREKYKLFPTIDGAGKTLEELERAGEVFWCREVTPMARRLAQSATVLHSPEETLAALAGDMLGKPIASVDASFVQVGTDEVAEQATPLIDALAALLAPATPAIHSGTFEGAEPATGRAWLGLDSAEGLHDVREIPPLSVEAARQAKHIVLNRNHGLVERLGDIAREDPDWAALMLLLLTCPDATDDDASTDQLVRGAYRRATRER